ncbi:MAG: hypothetical protein WD512_18390 [Candidatus Paceibacterota bacterium]
MATFEEINSRIEKLFEDINVSTDYFAAKDHTCCNTCGHAEIEDKMDNVLGKKISEKKKGFIFYHTQETDSILQNVNNRKQIILEKIKKGPSGQELPVHLNFNVWKDPTDFISKDDDDAVTERCREMLYKLKPLAISHNMRFEWAETMTKKMLLYVIL